VKAEEARKHHAAHRRARRAKAFHERMRFVRRAYTRYLRTRRSWRAKFRARMRHLRRQSQHDARRKRLNTLTKLSKKHRVRWFAAFKQQLAFRRQKLKAKLDRMNVQLQGVQLSRRARRRCAKRAHKARAKYAAKVEQLGYCERAKSAFFAAASDDKSTPAHKQALLNRTVEQCKNIRPNADCAAARELFRGRVKAYKAFCATVHPSRQALCKLRLAVKRLRWHMPAARACNIGCARAKARYHRNAKLGFIECGCSTHRASRRRCVKRARRASKRHARRARWQCHGARERAAAVLHREMTKAGTRYRRALQAQYKAEAQLSAADRLARKRAEDKARESLRRRMDKRRKAYLEARSKARAAHLERKRRREARYKAAVKAAAAKLKIDRRLAEARRRERVSKQQLARQAQQRKQHKRRVEQWRKASIRKRKQQAEQARKQHKRALALRQKAMEAYNKKLRKRLAARRAKERAAREKEHKRERAYKATLRGKALKRAKEAEKKRTAALAAAEAKYRAKNAARCNGAKRKYFTKARAAVKACHRKKKGSERKACRKHLVGLQKVWYQRVQRKCVGVRGHSKCVEAKRVYKTSVREAGKRCLQRSKSGEERRKCFAKVRKSRASWFQQVKHVCAAYPMGKVVSDRKACRRARKTQKKRTAAYKYVWAALRCACAAGGLCGAPVVCCRCRRE
jgi:hypothetical protein